MAVIEYRVKYGDTLQSIAKKAYGNEEFAAAIYQHNRHDIANINQVYPGQVICLPRIHNLAMVVGL